MRVTVRAKPKSRRARLEKIDATHFVICVKEAARGGKANTAIINALASHFHIAPSRIELVRGRTAKEKIFTIAL